MPVGGDEDVLHARVELHARHLCGELDRILCAGGATCGRGHTRVVQDEAAVLALLVTHFNIDDIYWGGGHEPPGDEYIVLGRVGGDASDAALQTH
jgi:hypothetical protein